MKEVGQVVKEVIILSDFNTFFCLALCSGSPREPQGACSAWA